MLKDTEAGNNNGGSGLTGTVTTGQVAGIGRQPDGTAFFYGAEDDIGVWNRALTAAEISYLAAGHQIPATAAPLNISAVSLESGQIVVRWTGGVGPYQLQRRASLTSGNWENVGGTTAGMTASDTATAQVMFYRVIKAQ